VPSSCLTRIHSLWDITNLHFATPKLVGKATKPTFAAAAAPGLTNGINAQKADFAKFPFKVSLA